MAAARSGLPALRMAASRSGLEQMPDSSPSPEPTPTGRTSSRGRGQRRSTSSRRGSGLTCCWTSRAKLLAVDAATPFAARGARRARRMGAVAQLGKRLLRQIGVEWTWPGRKAGHRRAGVTAAGRAARGQRFQFEPARGAAVPRGDGRRVRGSAQTHQPKTERPSDSRTCTSTSPRSSAPAVASSTARASTRSESCRPWAVTSWITGPTGVSTSSAT